MQLKNGEYIVGGHLITQNGSKPDKIILIKLNVSGNIVWQKQLNNNYGSSLDEIVRLSNLQEGNNNDLIILSYDKNINNQNIVTRLSIDGDVIWSNALQGNAYIIESSVNITGLDNRLHFWAVSVNNPTNCFIQNEGLTYMSFDYETGSLNSAKTFCIPPGNAPHYIFNGWLNNNGIDSDLRSPVIKKLINGNSVVILEGFGDLLINLFDSSYNFIKNVYYTTGIPQNTNSPYLNFYFDVDEKNGDIAINMSIRDHGAVVNLPYQFYTFLDNELNLKKQLFVFQPGENEIFGSVNYLKNAVLNFTGISKQVLNPQFYQIYYNNTMPDGGIGAFCSARDTSFGTFSPHNLIHSGNFHYDSIISNIYTSADSNLFSISTLNITETTNCKIISICDSLKIQGPQTFCTLTDSFIYTAYKNPQCLKNIVWVTDSSFVQILRNHKDSLQVRFKKTGSTTIYASLAGCVLKDSIQVGISNPKTRIEILSDSLICPGETKVLKATSGFANYEWSTGSINDSAIALIPGWYFVTATDSCGNRFKDSLHLQMADTALSFLQYQTICNNDTLKIKLPSYVKNIVPVPNEDVIVLGNNLHFFPQQNSNYTLQIEFNGGCRVTKNLQVKVEYCPETVFVPNSFTPNNDGLNDRFKPIFGRQPAHYYFAVYNRFGQRVFETNNPLKAWDGTFKSAAQATATYTWQCSYAFANKPKKNLKGTVVLIR
ncbi:MAG TPA: gliding motility-associated C-terminal domain-containing protein [Ferruginibacter sp.]|nr:gliding motility-associated C-terminal domain-containing protein [Ferruginibacter sp.]